jgi:hypothetical protein
MISRKGSKPLTPNARPNSRGAETKNYFGVKTEG